MHAKFVIVPFLQFSFASNISQVLAHANINSITEYNYSGIYFTSVNRVYRLLAEIVILP